MADQVRRKEQTLDQMARSREPLCRSAASVNSRRGRQRVRTRRIPPPHLLRRHLGQTGRRSGRSEGLTISDRCALLTTEPKAEVGAIRPKARPVIPTTPEEWRPV